MGQPVQAMDMGWVGTGLGCHWATCEKPLTMAQVPTGFVPNQMGKLDFYYIECAQKCNKCVCVRLWECHKVGFRRGDCQQLSNARVKVDKGNKNREGKSVERFIDTVMQLNVVSTMQRG